MYKCFYSFPYIALDLARILTIMIVMRNVLDYARVNINTFISLITIWNFLGSMLAGFRSDFLLQNYKFLRPLMFTTILLVMARLGHVFIEFARAGLLYVVECHKSLRSCLVNVFHFINRKWGEGGKKVLKHLSSFGYMDLKKANLRTRNVAKGRWAVVFICFLITFPAEGALMRGAYSEPLSAQTISLNDTNQYVRSDHGASQTVVHLHHHDVPIFNAEKNGAGGDGKHFTKTTAATMEAGELKNRKLLKSREPRKSKPDVGQPAQHD